DPATAADVLRHLVEPLRVALTSPPRQRVVAGDDGRRVMLPTEPDRHDFVRLALSEIRLATGNQLLVIHAFIETVGSLLDQLNDDQIDPDQSGLIDQLDGLLGAIDLQRLGRRDEAAIRENLDRWSLVWPVYQPGTSR
ncbi:MAG: hypothetical protein OEO77_11845, partial [Acidimicrobiia bacterium]|nr:hypothetical protein [Acidimicrobiia bacterium]